MAYIWNPNTAGLLSSFDIQDKQNSTSMIKEGMFFLLCKKSQSAIESKSICHAVKILNKIMGHCNLNSTRNVYSGCFSTPTHMEESDIDKRAIENKDTSNFLEITLVKNLITLTARSPIFITLHSSEAAFPAATTTLVLVLLIKTGGSRRSISS